MQRNKNFKKLLLVIRSSLVILTIALLGWYAREILGPLDHQTAFVILAISILAIVGFLTYRVRRQVAEVAEREDQAMTLYHLSKDLAAAVSFDEVLEIVRVNIGKLFDCHVAIFLLNDERKLDVISFDTGFPITDEEKHIAQWVCDHNQPAGQCTEHFNESEIQYLPLSTSQEILGVLGIDYKEDQNVCDLRENYLLSTLANQAAIAIHRTKLTEVSRQIELMRETEKLQTALMNSISHDLKTPLVSIMGALESLSHDFPSLDQETRQELLATAYEDSDHLNRIVTNLLDMTRLESKALKMHIEYCELRDMIGASLRPLKAALEQRHIEIHIPKDFPEIPVDFVLMMRVFVNLVDNAVKYSASDTTIEISAHRLGQDQVRIDVKDQGIGIVKEDLNKIFDKFYRAYKPKAIAGTGLGLAICKGIVEAHGGEIAAKNNSDKGSTISVTLPLTRKEK